MARPALSAETRFVALIELIPFHSCWEWLGYIEGGGYGTFREGLRKTRAHIFSYKLYNGDIPNGLNVCHSCDNPSCVNPNHLWLGTSKQNAEDCVRKGRRPRGERHHKACLSYKDVASIKQEWKDKHTNQRIMAERYGVSKSTINAVLTGQNWSVIEEIH